MKYNKISGDSVFVFIMNDILLSVALPDDLLVDSFPENSHTQVRG